jgi:hypothetical protein
MGFRMGFGQGFLERKECDITTSQLLRPLGVAFPASESGKSHRVIEAYCRLIAYQDGNLSYWTFVAGWGSVCGNLE